MRNIEVKILNPSSVSEAEKMMVFCARLTQRGHGIKTMEDLQSLKDRPYGADLVKTLVLLPHPTIQKFGAINIAVVGASRRFLAQITRHQNEVKFMSASLQYSDYADKADFTVPYELLETVAEQSYLDSCKASMEAYKDVESWGAGNDAAGYAAPQGLRNVLIISATPFQWRHMIGQRTCNRNTKETQYVMLRIWEQLAELSPAMFNNSGPFCTRGKCMEGKMCCGRPVPKTPGEILKQEFPLLYKEVQV